jgi:hypothetical protein
LADDVPPLQIVFLLCVVAAAGAIPLYVINRIDLASQRLVSVENHETVEPPERRRLRRAKVALYAVLAVATFVLAGLDAYNPDQSGRQALGISKLFSALFFVYLAFREQRKGRPEAPSGMISISQRPEAPKARPVGSPKTTLIVIVIVTALLVAGDIRQIANAQQPRDVWIGAGQMMLWVPIFGFLAYREVRRLRKEKSEKGKPGNP